MLETSKTFFWFAFGLALLVVAGFGSYALYHWGQTIREAKKTLKDINKKLEKVENIIDLIASTVNSIKMVVNIIRPATIVSLASKVIQEIGKFVGIFRKKPKEKSEEKNR